MRASIFFGHGFSIAMVCGNQHHTTGRSHLVHDLAHARIHSLAGLDGGLQNTGMSYHIHIGEIQYDQIICGFAYPVQQLLCHHAGAHFRFQIISGDIPRRRYQTAVFQWKRILFAAIEEIRDMRVFFGFCNSKLSKAAAANDFSQNILQTDWRKRYRKRKYFFILGHADIGT